MSNKRAFYIILAIFSVVLLFGVMFGCNQNPFFGVGPEVDTERPSVVITSHLNGQWEKPSFSLSGNANDNIDVSNVKIREIKKDSNGVEYVSREWNASLNGGEGNKSWARTFDLTNDFNNEDGFKTLDVYAFDARENFANTRILLGVTKDMSIANLTSPIEENLPANQKFVGSPKDISFFTKVDNTSDKFDNLKYYFNKKMEIAGYTKAVYPPDKSVTLNIYDSQRKNIIYTDIINGDLSTDKAKGNTSTWTFRIDTTSLKLNNNVLDNTACYVEIVTKDQAGQDWKQGKGYVYVLQSTDYPNGEVTSPESVTLTDTVASGKVWDDDGIDKIYWYLGKNDPTTDYTQWGVYGWERDPVTGLIVIKNPNYAAGVMDLTADPLLYPWSLKTSSGIGDYKLYINPVDKFGVSLLERPSTKTFSEKGYKFTQKTVEPPKVESIDSPDIQATHNNNVTIKVSLNAGQGKLMNSVLYRIQSDKIKDIPTNTKWDSGWIERTDVSNDTKVTHSYTFDVNNYVSATIHDVKITIKCKNSIDEESQESFINIKADHSNPTLSITYPNANAGLNGKMAITSLLNDDWAGVKSLYVGYFASAPDMAGTYTTETALDTNTATNPTLGKWIKIDNPKAAMDVTFDSTVITSTKVNPYSLYIATVDKVGNVGFTSKQYNIDQDLDIPSSIISVPATNGDITLPSTLISGDASDDDGLKALYWFVGKIDPALNFGGGVNTGDPTADYTTWNTYTGVNASAGIFTFTGSPKSSSWKIDSPSGSGYYKVHTKVIDIGNKVQKTSATRNYTQKLTDKPEIVINGPDTSITYNKDVTIDVSLTGGSIDKVTKISYRVWSTLKQDDTTHDIVSPSLTPAVVINNYKIALNLQNFVNVNVHDVKVFVSCSNEVNKISQIQTISLKSDIVSPTVKILSPSLGTGINGMWDIAGEVTDDWAGIKSIYVGYFTSMTDTIMNTTYTKESSLNNATSTVPTNGKWYKLSQVSAAWSHGFDTTLIYNDETSHSYNFYVATVDNTGNVGYGKLNYNINQALDRPTAAITSPAINGIISPNSNGSGDASDDDGIKIIYWFVGKTDVDFGNGVGIAPTDYTTWDTFSDANSKGGIIDLSASNPKITSLNFTTPSGDGDYKISVMVVDKNNKPSSSVITRNYQQYASTTPTATLTGIDQSTTYKGSVNVNIAAYGGGPYSINKIEYRVDNGSWTDITGFTVGKTVNYILPINTVTYTSSTDSDVKVEVRCTNDNSIVSNISSVSFKADNTSPTFSISAPATNAGLNGVEHITGGISDNFSGVKSMYIGYFNGAINTTDYDTETELNTASTAGLTLNKWFKITAINAAYDVTFDTTKIYSDESSHAYTLYVASIDNVGNVTHINKSVTINQALDRPSISVSTPTNNSTLLPYSVASGSATDDDGVQYIYYYIGLTDPTSDYKTWGGIDNDQSTDTEKSGRLSVSGKTVSWNFRTPKGVGSFRMRLVPEDINGKPATSTTSVNYAQQTSDSPTIQINAPNASITHTGTVTVDVDTSGGGTKTVSQIKYQIKSTKLDSGIVTLSAPADFTAGQGSINKTFTFNSASYTDSSVHSIDIEVWTINSNAETSLHMKTTINADNVKPTINITFPNALAGLNGITTLTRVVSDDWSGLKSAYIGYFAGMTNGTMDTSYTTEASVIANSSTSLTLGKWFKLASVSASADVTFDTTVITSTVANPHNLYLVLVDNVGNLSYTSRAFDINQNYDRPDASISTPSNAAIVFPSSVVSGSANDDDVSNLLGGKDNDGLQYVYWFVGKSDVDFGNGVGNAPSDQATWSTYNTANAKGGVIDLTSTKPKTYAFQPTDIITPTGSGNYRIHIKPMDMKNKVPVANITRDYVQKASDIPAIEFVSSFPDTTTNYNGTVTVKVNANGGSIDNVTKIFYKVESTVLADGSYTEKTDFTAANTVNAYTFTFNINSYVSSTVHDVTVSVYCENAVAKTSQVTSITIKGDNTKPTVAITSPAANAGLNGNWSIAGTVSDDWSGAKAIYVGYFANMTNGTMDGTYTTEASLNPSGTPTINRWYQLSSATAAWSHTFDTTVITNSTGNPKNPYNLYVVAVDNVGNRQYTSRAFDINQDYDKPHVRILSPATNSRVSPLSIVSGDATDDDGVQYVYYYVCNDASLPALYTDWSSTVETAAHKGGRIDAGNATSYSWQLTTPSGVGSYTVYTRVVDMYGKPNDVNVSLAFKQFSTDVPTVSITSITADRSSGTKYYGNVVINTNSIGGDIDKVTKVYYRINSGSWVEHDVVDASPRTDSYTFDINPLVDGTTHDVLVEVKCDNEALKTSTIVSTTIQGDDTVPTLAIDSPANNATDLNKWWTVRGTVSDDLAGVKTLYYGYFAADPTMTDYDTEAELEASASTDLTTDIMVTKSWHKVPFTNQYSWTYSYNTSKITATTKTNYKLYVVAVDNLGMVNSSIYKTVNINQDADKPTVTILSPASASRVSPSSIASGSSIDDDGIKYIYWFVGKVDAGMNFGGGAGTGDPTADYNTWTTGTLYSLNATTGRIDLSGTNPASYSWQFTTPSGVGSYKISMWIVDKYDVASSLVTTVSYKQLTTDVPTVTVTSPTSLTSPSIIDTRTGNVTITVNASGGDIDKVKKISYKVGSDAWVDYAVDAQTVTGHTHTFNIDGYVDASNHDLLVQVRCENDAIPTAKTSTIVPINLKGDDTKPTVSISNPSWGASGLNGTWSILGSVSDDWAGVKTLYYGYFSSDPDMTNDFDTEAELLADSDTSLSNVSTTTKHWHKVTFSQPSWTYSFDTTKVADGTYKLYVAAVDNVGKVSWAYRPFGIDQNADKPTSIVNVPTNGQNTFPGSVASGSATDDDGLKYIYWYIGSDAAPALYTDWPSTVENSVHKGGLIDLSSSNPATYSWQLITPSGVGSYTVYIRTVDMNNVVQAANITRNYSQSTSTSPVSQITSPDPSVTQKGTMVVNVHSTGGGSYNVIKVHYRITSTKGAGQDSGWQFVTIGSPYSEGDTTFDVDTTTYVDATVHDVKVEVYSENDNSGYSQHVTTYFRGDNNPPSVTISSPTAPSTINGVQKFSGTDSDWSTVKALYISYYETTPTGSISTEADLETRTSATDNGGVITGTLIKDSFYKIVSPSTSWTHNFDTLIVKPTGSIASYNFYIYAVDNVGNIQSATNTYSLDQDLDKPQALITQPAYSGSQVTPWLDVASMNKYGQDFLLMGTGSDDDGVDRVRFTLQLMDYTGGGHSVNSTIDNLTTALGTANWSYTKSGLAICTASQYYKLTTEVRDINGRVESGATSYFIVSNEIPVIDIMWPSTLDPDNDQRYDESITQKQRANDSFGTVISNVRDDIYWDNDTTNNHMYLKYNGNYPSSDTTQSHYDLRYFYGWENQVANDDSNNDGIPETPAVTYADFNESTLSIFNTEASDSTRANYFRMIFKAKDPNSGGDIRKVEYSTNGGSTWTTAFNWNGTILANQDTSKYAKVDNQGGDGYTWFYIDLDTSILGTSQIVKVRITDNNLPTAYFSESSMQMTFDNTAPTGSFVAWGTADPSDHQNFSITNSYFGGNADDAASGVRYAKLYIWDNQGTADSPTYGDGSGTITVNLNNPTRTVKVSIPNDISTILPTGGTDIQPDYLLKANMYTPQNWRVTDMYGDINTKYAQYPSDGRKLICLEVTDNAGNTYKTFTELEFSEFPAVVGTSNIYYGPMTSGEKFALSDQTTSGRIWVSGNLNLDGVVADSKPGDTLPGIERVRVYVKSNDGLSTYNTYSTESDGTVEINTYSDAGLTTPQALPTANSSSVYWKLSPQATSSINGGTPGNYLMVIEVRDVTGVTTIRNQYIYVDNTSPTLTVTQPTEALAVAGSFKIFGTGSDTGGFQTNSIKIEIMFTGSPVGAPYIWYTSPDGLSNWQQIWDTTGPVNFDAVRITFTDKAKNSTVITRNISRDPNPPQFDSFSVTDTDGVATQMTYSTFAGFYSTIIGNSFYLVRGNLTFANQISDANDAISSSSVYIGGTLQNGTGVAETNQVFNPSADASAPYQVGQSSTYPANGLGDGDYRYRANIFQQGGALEIDLNKYFVVDNQKPHIWLLNMKNSDFNGYGTSTNKGHIDTSLNSNGITTNDDDVSGVITMYVKVWDNYLLNNVQVRMADYNFGNGDNGWFNLISRDPSTGVWGTPATRGVIGDLNYFSASIVSQDLTANKDYIYLKLDFNTANLTGVVGLTKNIEFRTYDMAGNESLAGDASTSSEVDRNEDIPGSEPSLTYSSPNSSYQKWVRKTVDVVPYISSIVRSVGAANTMRTKYGKYIVREGETDLTVNGYNLAENGTSWLRVYNTAGSAQDEVTIADYIANATYTALGSVSLATITHSGYVRVMVNGIETINNVNLNTNATNQESSVFTQGSELWNDDRYVHVWKTGTSFNNSLNPVHPAMDMNPSNNALSASWSYYASAQVYYGSTSGRTTIRTSYDPPEYTDIAVDTNGDVHVVYLQNEYANDNATWGYLVSYDSNGGTGYIEHLGNGSGTAPNYSDGMDEQLYQFQNPRITVNNDYNYVSYYDAHSKTLKYGVTTNTTETFTAENPTANRTNGAIVVDGVEDTTAPPTTTGDDVGVWSDIQIDDKMGADVATPRPVIIYYDTTNSKLKIARANGNPTVTRPDNSSEWTKSDVFRTDDPNKNYAGTNVSMKIDSNGDLYVVCYKIDTGDLIYLHAPNIDGDGTYTFDYSTVIDSNGAVGSWADIYVVGTTPYISYLTSGGIGTFYGLKYAYYDTVKSDWEYGIAAANSAVLDKRTSILAVSTGIAAWGGTKGKVAIAYGSSNYDIVYLEDEE